MPRILCGESRISGEYRIVAIKEVFDALKAFEDEFESLIHLKAPPG
jgi:hypothetical protein